MDRTCKECGFVGLYDGLAASLKVKGFHGYVCYACYLKEQREWRQTALGREAANEASRISARRIRAELKAQKDAQNALKEATLRRN